MNFLLFISVFLLGFAVQFSVSATVQDSLSDAVRQSDIDRIYMLQEQGALINLQSFTDMVHSGCFSIEVAMVLLELARDTRTQIDMMEYADSYFFRSLLLPSNSLYLDELMRTHKEELLIVKIYTRQYRSNAAAAAIINNHWEEEIEE
jgi:hypothetical protein